MNPAEDVANDGVMTDTTPVVVPDYRKVYRFAVWMLSVEMGWAISGVLVLIFGTCDFQDSVFGLGLLSFFFLISGVPLTFLIGVFGIFGSRRSGQNGRRFLLLVAILVVSVITTDILRPFFFNLADSRGLGCEREFY